LIAISDSPSAALALHLGVQLVRGSADIPALLTVVQDERDRPGGEEILDLGRRSLGGRTPEFKELVRVGHPAEEILREAERENYELIVMGQQEKQGLVTRFALGTTSERVVEHAPCPVMIAKGMPREIRRILLCDSGAESPSLAEEPLTPILSRFTSQLLGMLKGEEEILVLHVMSQISAGPGVDSRELRAEAAELMASPSPEGTLLKQDVDLLTGKGATAKAKIRHGFVVDEILEEAESGGFDLVVIGAHRGPGWQRFLLDDIARKVIARIDRPILIVR
jgi:nucleotide-binding universal stress UspA family protein